MNTLYPKGHQPFIHRGICQDDSTAERIQEIGQKTSLANCLNLAHMHAIVTRGWLEEIRASLFRAEQLIERQPIPTQDLFVLLPHEIGPLLETLEATKRCLEQWLESEACQALLAKYPEPSRFVALPAGYP
jgi:hypothetical protein